MITLETLQMYAAQRITNKVLEMPTPAFTALFEREMDMMLWQLHSKVWARDAGPIVEDTAYIIVKMKPRWIPNWIWDRIPERRHHSTLRVQPKYVYPTFSREIGEYGYAQIYIQQPFNWGVENPRANH